MSYRLDLHLSEMGEPALVDTDCWRLAGHPDKIQLLPAWAEAFVSQVDAIALRIRDKIEAVGAEAILSAALLDGLVGNSRTSRQ